MGRAAVPRAASRASSIGRQDVNGSERRLSAQVPGSPHYMYFRAVFWACTVYHAVWVRYGALDMCLMSIESAWKALRMVYVRAGRSAVSRV